MQKLLCEGRPHLTGRQISHTIIMTVGYAIPHTSPSSRKTVKRTVVLAVDNQQLPRESGSKRVKRQLH